MVETGKRMGKKMVALITSMDQPLGRAAGHANEVAECIDVLNGGGPEDVRELSVELSAWMFYLGEKIRSVDEGRALAEEMIASGKAPEKFRECVRLQGGDQRVIDEPALLPQGESRVRWSPVPSADLLRRSTANNFGVALAMLGGGRETKEDHIDHAVGLEFHKRIGDRVEKTNRWVQFITIAAPSWMKRSFWCPKALRFERESHGCEAVDTADSGSLAVRGTYGQAAEEQFRLHWK